MSDEAGKAVWAWEKAEERIVLRESSTVRFGVWSLGQKNVDTRL